MATQTPPLHPIAAIATSHIEGHGRALQLTKDGIHALRVALRATRNPLELSHAVHSLVSLAAHLELDHGAVDAADMLLAVARRAGGVLGGHVISRRRRALARRPKLERRSPTTNRRTVRR